MMQRWQGTPLNSDGGKFADDSGFEVLPELGAGPELTTDGLLVVMVGDWTAWVAVRAPSMKAPMPTATASSRTTPILFIGLNSAHAYL
jgi:hypothetical protein